MEISHGTMNLFIVAAQILTKEQESHDETRILFELELTVAACIYQHCARVNCTSFQLSGFPCFLCSLKGLEDKRHRGPSDDQLPFLPFFIFICFPKFFPPNADMDRCVRLQTPFGRGLTLTLQGLCLSAVIATPQARCAASASV